MELVLYINLVLVQVIYGVMVKAIIILVGEVGHQVLMD